VHSHTRRARSEGIETVALAQVAPLAVGPLGLPRAVAALPSAHLRLLGVGPVIRSTLCEILDPGPGRHRRAVA